MAQKSQTGGTEKNGSSLLYSKSDFKEGALQWVKDPPQGQVLLVLSMDNTCPSSSFDMDLCADKLQSLGIQVPMDPWRRLIQEGVLRPEVRRYLFYSSRGFQIAMAVVFYISLWTNLYSTLQLCSLGHSWGAGVLVTLVALALTVLVILVIDGHQRKLNVNTDVRLAAVNEIFIKHSIILGITDVLDGPHSILQLWFVHFSPEHCLQALAAHITHLQGTQAGLRHRLNKLWVVMDVAAQPELQVEEEAPCEESPLLSRGVTLNKDPVTCSELLPLIPEGPPQVRRNIPLTAAPNHPQGISAPKLISAVGHTTFSSSRSTWKATHTFSSPGAARRRRKPLKT
ncbi:transmembrane protein 268 isoform X1 [Pyrgilauda ruficollis]|uniref:transmembrane protein 268 isoform X1 n=1 Tax=Pyrgilauda ruficollis TaxID=221976 RepID=UPI001B8744CE|nr:transmembrane protein 268 isoform X1 [Pyrgilauda ruficollis]XP_041330704.1 transmembrane protein 268 isoform X1 [Pyrgilauda ruficollis]XP_041330705.1 transmembrane protein 268 isoform X1 [Pyrgilauda ruficollis]